MRCKGTARPARSLACFAREQSHVAGRRRMLLQAGAAVIAAGAGPAASATAAPDAGFPREGAGHLSNKMDAARRKLEEDFEQRYGRKSAYARRLVAPAKVHLPIDQVSALIEQDFVDRQYFITVKGGALLLYLRPLRMSPCIVYIADDTGTHVRQPSPEPPCFTQ